MLFLLMMGFAVMLIFFFRLLKRIRDRKQRKEAERKEAEGKERKEERKEGKEAERKKEEESESVVLPSPVQNGNWKAEVSFSPSDIVTAVTFTDTKDATAKISSDNIQRVQMQTMNIVSTQIQGHNVYTTSVATIDGNKATFEAKVSSSSSLSSASSSSASTVKCNNNNKTEQAGKLFTAITTALQGKKSPTPGEDVPVRISGGGKKINSLMTSARVT